MPSVSDISRSLAFKVGVVIIAVEMAVLTAVGYVYVSRFNAEIDERLRTRISIPGQLIRNGTLRIAAIGDGEVMRELIGGALKDALVVDDTNTIVYTLNDTFYRTDIANFPGIDVAWLRPEPGPPFHYAPDALVSVTPIYTTDESRPAFFVILRMGTEQAQADRARVIALVVFGSLAAVVLTSIAIVVLFRKTILERLSSLVEVVRKVGEGNFEARTAGPVVDDELGRVQRGIDWMTGELKRRESELARHRDRLEELVQERTAELKEVQEALVKQERLAVLGQLTATVSHELRNPLGAMRTSVAAIKKLSRKADPLLKSSADIVDRSITRCDTVIADLLSYVQAPKLYEEPTVVDELLTETLAEYILPAPEIVLRKKLGCDTVVNVDRGRLRRALENVLSNACQAMTDPVNGITIDSDRLLTVASRTEDGRAEIEITDVGCGVPLELREKIFEPLFTTKGFGVGLGLPIVKGIMEEHGGGVELTSTVGEGTQVVLWLPSQMAVQDGDKQ